MNLPSLVCAGLGDLGGSAYYRVIIPLLMTDSYGHIQYRVPPNEYFYPLEILKVMKPDTLLFHKTHTPEQRKYVNEVAHNLDVLKVYTIDDWFGKVPKESPHYKDMPKGVDKDVKKIVGLCDRLIVTNDVLANVYGYKKDVTIIPNYLPEVVWNMVYVLFKREPNDNRIPRIGWSGGMGHPGDLRILREIADILGDRVQWVFQGDQPPGFDQGNSEIRNGVVPTEYAKALYSLDLDLALAPLLDNDFNRAKSNLRILEYAACGYPVIASNVKTYQGTPATLLDYNAKWWANEILKQIEDRDALRAKGQEMKDWVWQNYRMEDHLLEYGNVLSPDKQAFVPSIPEVEDVIDIVITTRNQKEMVERCINSVLETLPDIQANVELVVTDNASDEVGMQEYLANLAVVSDKITVLTSETDEGYVNNVNKGLMVHPNRDAIILNSDTVVHGDWVDRLREISDGNPRIASVTPFTNNGTICSYPKMTGSELEVSKVRFYDSVVKDLPLGEALTLPTPVGFCTYLKRAALADLGLFDAHAFHRGYGEENDWSLRAAKRMWSHALGHTVYVGHEHGASFGPEKQKLQEASARTLVVRWPKYGESIEKWLQSNTLQGLRQHIDIESVAKLSISERTLYIAHGFGGGLETYLQSQLDANPSALILRNDMNSPGMATLHAVGDDFNLPQLSIRLSSMEFLRDMLTKFNVTKISLQTTFGYDYNFPTWVMNLATIMNIPYEMMLHDYWTICPRLRLVQETSYCGEPDVETCNACVIKYGSGLGQVDVGDWRDLYHDLLNGASKVSAPSTDLANRLAKYFPDVDINVTPHEEEVPIHEYDGTIAYPGSGEIRIAVIGHISPDKGSLVVRDCAAYCQENKLPVKFIVFGNLIDQSAVLKMIPPTQNLSIQGQYEEGNLKTLLELNKCHLALFPSLWPETYSYTLSHAFKAGLWPVAFDIGAIAERIKARNFGTILPFELSKDPSKTMQAIMHLVRSKLTLEDTCNKA